MFDRVEYTFDKKILTITKCPSCLKQKHITKIMNKVSKNTNIINKIIIPEGVEKIGECAFQGVNNIKKIVLPDSLKRIEDNAFKECVDLQSVIIPSGVEYFGRSIFSDCKELREVNLPFRISDIPCSTFQNCINLKKVIIPENITLISSFAFENSGIKNVEIPSSVKTIGTNVFQNCRSLEKVILPTGITSVPEFIFNYCSKLKEVVIPEGVTEIEVEAFRGSGIRKIKLPSTLVKICSAAFSSCEYLNDVEIPEGVEEIEYIAFFNSGLKKVSLPSTLSTIGGSCFSMCYSLKKINIPKNVVIGHNAFEYAVLNELDMYANTKLSSLMLSGINGKLRIIQEDGSINIIDCEGYLIYSNDSEYFFQSGIFNPKFMFYYNNKSYKFNKDELFKKANSTNGIENIDEEDYIKLYFWVNKNKFLPCYKIVEIMPISDIDLFYINGNCKKWKNLLDTYEISSDEVICSLFKLCYVLGLFQKEGSKSDKAYNFVIKNILDKMSKYEIHDRFDGFNISNGYDKLYADFFMKYYNDDFMMLGDVDLLASSYNNFNNVKEVYKSKVVNTNRMADMLLPSHVLNILKNMKYDNVDVGNENLATEVSKYGYSQSDFELLQTWFNIGKNVNKDSLKIFINDDIKSEKIVTYELLEKDNPLGAVLGNITNCCQVVNGAGESCVEYGMTMPNSKFMTFNYKRDIIGQAWVWYDEKTGVVCLDNIEVPEKYLDKINHNKEMQKEFVGCLKRMATNFISEMENHGLKVKKVTVGKGYNDIKNILSKNFNEDNKVNKLTDYVEYSDADNCQYIVNSK